MRLSRRALLKQSASIGLLGASGPLLAEPQASLAYQPRPGVQVEPLRDSAAQAGVKFGCSFDMAVLKDKDYAALIKHHCAILTTDYQLKFNALRPSSGEANFRKADQLVQFAERAKLPLRGHALIWNESRPDWLVKSSSKAVAYWLDRHVEEVMGRYQGQMQSWDVVNEPIWPDHKREKGFRGGPWTNALGTSYVKRAFDLAARVDPKAKRVLNEAWLERDDRRGRMIRQAFLPFIRDLLEQGTPIDAVGVQCHLQPGNTNMDAFMEVLLTLKEWGLQIYVTELDVDDARLADDAHLRDQQVADEYSKLLQALLPLGAETVPVIQTWRLSDRYAIYERPKHRPVSALPFDEAFQTRPAYQAIRAGFSQFRQPANAAGPANLTPVELP